jgi:hypothetical protein
MTVEVFNYLTNLDGEYDMYSQVKQVPDHPN